MDIVVEKPVVAIPDPSVPAAKASEKANDDKGDTKGPSSLLSFGDDDEDTEVFKVKKSSYSRRLTKQMEREKKKKMKEAVKAETKVEKEKPTEEPEVKNPQSPQTFSDELEIKIKNTFKILNAEEIKQLTGSTDDESDGEEGGGGGIKFRKYKNVIQSGVIPDAATIYALKKQRQLARERSDFIPLEDENSDEKARPARPDDDDQSDEEEGRISFTVNTAAIEKQRAREALQQAQEEASGTDGENEDVAELERWEQEQMKKGVSTAPLILPEENSEPHVPAYFTSYPPPEEASREPVPAAAVVPLQVPKDKRNLTTESIVKRVADRLASVEESLAAHERQKMTALADVEAASQNREELEEELPELASRFQFFQEIRSYVNDLIGCLDSKMPIILALEGRTMSLLCQRTERLVQRRHQDVKDQSEEFSLAIKNARTGPNPAATETKGNNARNWRAAEREGRRVRRRKAREAKKTAASLPHYEGMSTDDEEPDADVANFNKEREEILDDTRHVFDDVVEEFSNVTALKLKFEHWKLEQPESYDRAYVPLCLVKIVAPFVRLHLVPWNPIENPENLENSPWYEALLFYGNTSDSSPGQPNSGKDDPDLCLIPRVMERVVVPKLSAFAEKVWDPLSSRQTLNLVRVAKKLVEDYPNVGGRSRHVQSFLSKVASRIQKAIDDDVYIPLYPREVLDNRSGPASAFFQRQFWSCLKLMKNIMTWYGVLAEDPLKELTLCSLLNRYLIFALQNCINQRDTVEKCKMVVSVLPVSWIRGPSTPLPQLELFVRFLKLYQQHLEKLCAGGEPSELNSHAKDSLEELTKILTSLTATDKSKSKGKK